MKKMSSFDGKLKYQLNNHYIARVDRPTVHSKIKHCPYEPSNTKISVTTLTKKSHEKCTAKSSFGCICRRRNIAGFC